MSPPGKGQRAAWASAGKGAWAEGAGWCKALVAEQAFWNIPAKARRPPWLPVIAPGSGVDAEVPATRRGRAPPSFTLKEKPPQALARYRPKCDRRLPGGGGGQAGVSGSPTNHVLPATSAHRGGVCLLRGGAGRSAGCGQGAEAENRAAWDSPWPASGCARGRRSGVRMGGGACWERHVSVFVVLGGGWGAVATNVRGF